MSDMGHALGHFCIRVLVIFFLKKKNCSNSNVGSQIAAKTQKE